MKFSSSPLSPVPINFDEASIAGSSAQPSPVKLHDQFDRMPRVSRSRPRPSTQVASTDDYETEYVATHKPKSQKQSQKRMAQSSPKALEPQRSRQTRRGNRNAISYAESDSEDEPTGVPDRETSSEIDVDSTPVKPQVYEAQDIVSVTSASPPEPTDTKVKPRSVRKRLPLRGNWSVSHLLQSDKSKLKDCDLEVGFSHVLIASKFLPSPPRLYSATQRHGPHFPKKSSENSVLCFQAARLIPQTPLPQTPCRISHNGFSKPTQHSARTCACFKKNLRPAALTLYG